MKRSRPLPPADCDSSQRRGDRTGVSEHGAPESGPPVLAGRPADVKLEERRGIGIVCVGAGRGERFGGDKLAVALPGGTVLERSLAALAEALPSSPLAVVLPAGRMSWWAPRLSRSFPDARLVAGGTRRQDSVQLGVQAILDTGVEFVLVHDAARPLVHPDDIVHVARMVGQAPGVILCRRIPDTVKRVDAQGWVVKTLDRTDLRLALTPQGFQIDRLVRAWRMMDRAVTWTDEGMLLEMAGDPVMMVEALHPNPKLTTRSDLVWIRNALDTGVSS